MTGIGSGGVYTIIIGRRQHLQSGHASFLISYGVDLTEFLSVLAAVSNE